VYAFGEVDGVHFFAMELVEGHDLHREIELQRGHADAVGIPPGRSPILPRFDSSGYYAAAAQVVSEAADSLHCAHENDVVHRDVKPQNILIRSTGRVTLVDFGIARDEGMGRAAGHAEEEGTPYYMSPEQVERARAVVDRRTDVYSLGVVLYEMLTLRLPFDGPTPREVLDSIVRFSPTEVRKANSHVPRDLALVCMTAMSRSPRDRYATAADLRDDLRRFLAHEAVHAPSPTSRDRVFRWVRCRYRQFAAVTALLLALVTAASLRHRWSELELKSLASTTAEVVITPVGAAPSECRVFAFRETIGLDGDASESPPAIVQPTAQDATLRFRLAPGEWRIAVDARERGCCEIRRSLQSGVPCRVVAWIRPTLEVIMDMQRVDGGTVEWQATARARTDSSRDDLQMRRRVPPAFIDVEPVTNAEYGAFARATGIAVPPHWQGTLPESWRDRPVTMIEFDDARACAEWYGKRLLTYAEFEWLTKGSSGSPFPIDENGEVLLSEAAFRAPEIPTHAKTDEGGWQALHDWYERAIPTVDALPPLGAVQRRVRGTFGFLREWVDEAPIEFVDGHYTRQTTERYRCGMSGDESFERVSQSYGHEVQIHAPRIFPDPSTGFRCAKSVDPFLPQ
jgi:formylglycine-generating enzyme required for sulfatase activity